MQRHKTAMVRHTLSQPMSLLVRHGLVGPEATVFDYGCGQGDDLRALAAAGVTASGWDPHFAPDVPQVSADVVNLGFVLNVIEDAGERLEALRNAWSLSRKLLAVSTMIIGQVPVDGLRPYGDGYLTSRGTFQKYFQHAELRAVVAQVTGVEPVALAPGIFVAFRCPEDEQDFLLQRRRSRRSSTAGYRVERPRRAAIARPEVHERIATVIEEMAAFAMDRGRLPHPEELTPTGHEKLSHERVSFTRALELCREVAIDEEAFSSATAARREDLLVHHALGILNRTRSASQPSPAIIRDVRAHFGSQRELGEQALEYLHALADAKRTAQAMEVAAELGVGIIDEDGRLVVDAERIESMPGVLRCYIGCAFHLSGEIDGPCLVRLDPLRKRLTLFPLEEWDPPFPVSTRSVSIDLRKQDVYFRLKLRRLVRKADIFGMSPRSKQRQLERQHREQSGLGERIVLEHVAG
ncbi:DNA phosphorothioation-associated putative methyltransferase [Sphingomonas sp.]|uniref:DNA phosphorothioation-associated putative methyltransferase n=1 Tax=Sphingomonas sp. TaxID=28214 RepID=UPI002DE744C6|nr:DNA phosphorothioation-associated putative methyltransferase [Sphingomonas sp.]